jgi:hypothetical protein
MTVFGKILVMLNLALSLMLAAWAFGVWSDRIDFSNTKASGERTAGEFARREAELASLWEGVRPAEAGWQLARADLRAQEKQRDSDLAWYYDQVQHLLGKPNPAEPVKVVVWADRDDEKLGVRRGQVALDPRTLRPVMAPAKDAAGNPLLSLAAYDAEERKVLSSIDEVQNKFQKQVDQAIAYTEQLLGPKGLQQRLLAEKGKLADVQAEEKLVRPLLVNTAVDSELVFKRQKSLEERVKELERVGVAAGK